MKIAIASDLHLEFGDLELPNQGADVLVLAGDVCLAEDLHDHPASKLEQLDSLGVRQASAKRYRDFFARCSEAFPHVIYIAGNHEFYHGRWKASIDHLREECAAYPNVYFLERDVKKIDDVVFVGGTLWTDMNKGDPLTLHAVNSMMSDFSLVRNDERGFTKLRPAHVAYRHRQTVEYFNEVLNNNRDSKCVVVGHHCPSPKSIHPRFASQVLMNGAYFSDLEQFIVDHPQVKLWVHGHTHNEFDYLIDNTRVVCNPRGYIGHDRSVNDLYNAKIVEV